MVHARQLVAALTALLLLASGAAADPRADCLTSHLRAEAPWIAEVMCGALPRSPTLQRLHARLADAAVIVYVYAAPRRPDGVEGRLRLIGGAAGWCYLRIDVHRQRDDAETAALLAHELQHVVEVADAGVVDSRDWAALYGRIGVPQAALTGEQVDTAEAVVAGAATLRELTGRVAVIPAFAAGAFRAAGLVTTQ
jgi:hypothetical protein